MWFYVAWGLMELILLVLCEILGALFEAAGCGLLDACRQSRCRQPGGQGISPIWLFLGVVIVGLLLLLSLMPAHRHSLLG